MKIKKNRKIFISAIILLVLIIIGFRMILLKIDNSIIEQITYYKDAVNTILNNLKEFESIDRSMEIYKNKYKFGNPPFEILTCGWYYYKNTVLEKSKADLSEITELWDKGLIKGEFNSLRIFTDSTIIFRVHEKDMTFLWINHHLIYGTDRNIDKFEEKYFRTYRFDNNWIYIVGVNSKFSGFSE